MKKIFLLETCPVVDPFGQIPVNNKGTITVSWYIGAFIYSFEQVFEFKS